MPNPSGQNGTYDGSGIGYPAPPPPAGGAAGGALGTAENPVTDANAPRPNFPIVWWKTSTIPVNAQSGDVRMVP